MSISTRDLSTMRTSETAFMSHIDTFRSAKGFRLSNQDSTNSTSNATSRCTEKQSTLNSGRPVWQQTTSFGMLWKYPHDTSARFPKTNIHTLQRCAVDGIFLGYDDVDMFPMVHMHLQNFCKKGKDLIKVGGESIYELLGACTLTLALWHLLVEGVGESRNHLRKFLPA